MGAKKHPDIGTAVSCHRQTRKKKKKKREGKKKHMHKHSQALQKWKTHVCFNDRSLRKKETHKRQSWDLGKWLRADREGKPADKDSMFT